MSYLPTIAHDAARAALLGIECAGCGENFTRAHQEPVVCRTCFRLQAVPEYPRAIYEEQTKAFFANKARTQKAKRKESKWAGLAIGTTKGETE